jgi:hypothetical protein
VEDDDGEHGEHGDDEDDDDQGEDHGGAKGHDD